LRIDLHVPKQFLDLYKPSSKIILKIEIYDFQADNIHGFIRNIIPGNDSCLNLGIEFEKLSAEETRSLQSTLLKIDRDRRNIEKSQCFHWLFEFDI
jgi:hypothetical protein